MRIYDYPKKGTIPLGVHLMQTMEFTKKALEMTLDMIPALVKVQHIRREMALRRKNDPNIIGEGPESSEELNDETLGVTEQGI